MSTPSADPETGTAAVEDSSWWKFPLLALLLVVTVVLIVLGGRNSEAFIGAVLAAAGAVYQATRAPERRQVLAMAGAVVVAVVVGVGILLYQWLQPDDVFTRATLDGVKEVEVQAGDSVQGSVSVKASGDRLHLVLDAQDVPSGGSPCLPVAALEFTGKDLRHASTVELQQQGKTVVLLDLATSARVGFDMRLQGVERGCRISVELKEAAYK